MNTKKTKFSIKTTGRYLRDFSIVVAGIAVTLWMNGLISERSEKRDTKLYLEAVKTELEYNCWSIDSVYIKAYEKSFDYIHYISSHDKSLLNPDTIKSYEQVYYNIIGINFHNHSFEMFKNSGNMRFIRNRELQQSIWEIYDRLSVDREIMSEYYRDKLIELRKEMHLLAEGKSIPIPMYHFYYSFNYEDNFEVNTLVHLDKASKRIKKIIAEIEKEIE